MDGPQRAAVRPDFLPRAQLVRLVYTFLTTYAVLLVVAGTGQITDPFLHYDDYPALLLQPEGYVSKTLSEGRWFNYLWHLRGIETPPWANFQAYLAGWALFVAAAALNIFRSAQLRYPMLLSALIVLSPQTTLISGWFNSLIPGMWLMAAYSVSTLFVSARTGSLLLIPFVPIAIQAYTPYPFLMFAICLLREDRDKSLSGFIRVTLLFLVAFGAGILLTFSINFAVYGIFGVELAEWRDPNPAHDLAGLVANLPKLGESLHWAFLMTGFGKLWLSVFLTGGFLFSLVVLLRHDRVEVLALLTAMMSGLAVLSLHAVQEGILFPFRATYFLWFGIAVSLLRAIYLVQFHNDDRTRAPFGVLLVITCYIGLFVATHHRSLSSWQAETRDIAARVPADTEMIYIFGSYLAQNGHGGSMAQMPRDFSSRMRLLTGADTRMCSEAPSGCRGVEPPFPLDVGVTDVMMTSLGRTTYIRLPSTERRAER